MAQRVRRRQDDDRAARPPDSPLRHRRDRQRQLALQKPRRRSRNPRSSHLRNPGQLRRDERYRQNPPLKGVKMERRLTEDGSNAPRLPKRLWSSPRQSIDTVHKMIVNKGLSPWLRENSS